MSINNLLIEFEKLIYMAGVHDTPALKAAGNNVVISSEFMDKGSAKMQEILAALPRWVCITKPPEEFGNYAVLRYDIEDEKHYMDSDLYDGTEWFSDSALYTHWLINPPPIPVRAKGA